MAVEEVSISVGRHTRRGVVEGFRPEVAVPQSKLVSLAVKPGSQPSWFLNLTHPSADA